MRLWTVVCITGRDSEAQSPGVKRIRSDFRPINLGKQKLGRLVRWPDSRCGQFYQVVIGITEI
jgi:hypothetical protein